MHQNSATSKYLSTQYTKHTGNSLISHMPTNRQNNIKIWTYTIQSFNKDPIPLLDDTVDQTLLTFIFSHHNFNLNRYKSQSTAK